MKKIRLILLVAGIMISTASLLFTSCTKEGPAGANGKDGANGQNGKDANETCKLCHSPTMVDKVATEFQLAKHSWGTASFEESGNTTCDVCHTSKGFVYVCKNNIQPAFTFNSATGKYENSYVTVASDALGSLNCWACHTSLHTTYGTADLALTTTAPVLMNMWGGAKTINLAQDSGIANLCVKCHQPRPMTCGYDPAGRLLNYDSLKNFPKVVQYDTTPGVTNHGVKPTYRLDNHYGAVGAIYAGMGAIEYPGLTYSNSPHTTVAACQDCHMAEPMTGIAGGHAFSVRNSKESALGANTTWNFNGCNKTGCHADSPLDANSSKFKGTRTTIKGLLDDLAAKINEAGGGHDILHKNTDGTSNLWAGITTNNYDGYLDVYSASTNPTGYWQLTSQPKFPKLLNVQMGAIINFQLCLREYSLGIHNTQYVTALLTNTIDALNAAGLDNPVAQNSSRR